MGFFDGTLIGVFKLDDHESTYRMLANMVILYGLTSKNGDLVGYT